jgi:hypothetical protein
MDDGLSYWKEGIRTEMTEPGMKDDDVLLRSSLMQDPESLIHSYPTSAIRIRRSADSIVT